jgi:hypothetical protein
MMTTTMQQQQSSSFLPKMSVVSSFQPTTFSTTLKITKTSTTALNVFGTKKSKKMTAEEMEKYWQGEWVCKDCGYIYNRVRCLHLSFGQIAYYGSTSVFCACSKNFFFGRGERL